MSCCSTDGTNRFFSKHANRYVRQFKKRGLDKTQRRIAGFLRREGIESKTILEIGCGVGGLHQALVKHGAATATGIDISEGMVAKAKELATSAGLADRVRYYVGDMVNRNGEIPDADIVILDKVLCCYERPADLIQKSAGKCNELYAVSFPRSGFLGWIAVAPVSWLGRMLRWSFYPRYHDVLMLERLFAEQGLQHIVTTTTIVWQVEVFRK
jgi:SAM-dependent methyltransferase